jgi:DNA-binding CsgD family transcriptional regulator
VTTIDVGSPVHRLIIATPLVGRGAAVLTGRQRELVDHVENGRNNREIGIAMGVSATTVKTMLQRIYARTGTAGRMELVQWRAATRTTEPP